MIVNPYNPLLQTNRGQRGLGGFLKENAGIIGTGLGAAAGAFAGNPMMGAKIGGMAGSAVEGATQDQQSQQYQRPIPPGMFDYGGTRGRMAKKGGPIKIKGADHERGGIQMGNAEVEGGETMTDLPGGKYVFSKRLTVPGTNKTFAEMHEALVQRGAGQDEIDQLMSLQESLTGRSSRRSLKKGGYYAIKGSETNSGDPKYPINSADDVRDAWKLRSHGDYNISQEKLEQRIKRKAREYNVDLNTDGDKQSGGFVNDQPEDGKRLDKEIPPEAKGYFIPNPFGDESIGMTGATKWPGRNILSDISEEISEETQPIRDALARAYSTASYAAGKVGDPIARRIRSIRGTSRIDAPSSSEMIRKNELGERALGGLIDDPPQDGGMDEFVRRLHAGEFPNLGAAGRNLVGDTIEETRSAVSEVIRNNTGLGNRILNMVDPQFTIGNPERVTFSGTSQVSPTSPTVQTSPTQTVSQTASQTTPQGTTGGSSQATDPSPPLSGQGFIPSNPFEMTGLVTERANPSSVQGAGAGRESTSMVADLISGFTPQMSGSRGGQASSVQSGSNTQSAEGSGQGFGFNSDTLDSVLPYVPGAINAIRGIFGDAEGVNVPRVTIPRTSIREAQRMDTDVNVRPQIASANRAFRNIQADPNASTGQRQAAFSKLLRARAGIQAQKENKETQLRNRRQELVSRLTSRIDRRQALANQRAGTREAQSQQRAEAAKQNLLSSGVQQIVGARQRQRAMDAARQQNLQGVMAALAGLDSQAKKGVIESILPTIENPEMRSALQNFINNN